MQVLVGNGSAFFVLKMTFNKFNDSHAELGTYPRLIRFPSDRSPSPQIQNPVGPRNRDLPTM
ncbi:hypothetical protein AGR7C_pAt0224 [Agrobacterium deltaense Zutra 3/1]|uniref:Uncharacterized protein n=1 Tax=Agrobacterium deltaense Zutra 3/1 TaxID=1183427 RepID=A0A1S7S4W0_9HYPH|nr:hypothetical protein AGR7C_pAt0224 [Agrobacterium deltaense Zutra 3/1]